MSAPGKPTEVQPLLAQAPVVSATAVPVVQAQLHYAPQAVAMSRVEVPQILTYQTVMEDFLAHSQGLMIRERLWLSQILCAACEKQTQFKVAQWDPSVPDDADDQFFLSRQAMFQVREESECCVRYCCHQFRPLRLGVFPISSSMQHVAEGTGWPTDIEPILIMEKPLAVPCCCGPIMCCPPQMTVSRPAPGMTPETIGRVVFDWKFWNCCWPCTQYMNVNDRNDKTKFVLRRPSACDDGCTNCFAPSCLNRTHRTLIQRPGSDLAVGEISNVWPGCNARGCCLQNSAADNYIIKFPGDASPEDKALLMSGLFLHNFVYFEKRQNQRS